MWQKRCTVRKISAIFLNNTLAELNMCYLILSEGYIMMCIYIVSYLKIERDTRLGFTLRGTSRWPTRHVMLLIMARVVFHWTHPQGLQVLKDLLEKQKVLKNTRYSSYPCIICWLPTWWEHDECVRSWKLLITSLLYENQCLTAKHDEWRVKCNLIWFCVNLGGESGIAIIN